MSEETLNDNARRDLFAPDSSKFALVDAICEAVLARALDVKPRIAELVHHPESMVSNAALKAMLGSFLDDSYLDLALQRMADSDEATVQVATNAAVRYLLHSQRRLDFAPLLAGQLLAHHEKFEDTGDARSLLLAVHWYERADTWEAIADLAAKETFTAGDEPPDDGRQKYYPSSRLFRKTHRMALFDPRSDAQTLAEAVAAAGIALAVDVKPKIIELVDHPHSKVKGAALEALVAHYRDERYIHVARQALASPDELVAEQAAWGLAFFLQHTQTHMDLVPVVASYLLRQADRDRHMMTADALLRAMQWQHRQDIWQAIDELADAKGIVPDQRS